MSSNTMVEADIWTVAQTDQGNVVLVRPRHSDVAVPIFIGALETQSILIGLGKVDMPRPLTHDLFLDTIGVLGGKVDRVEIHDLRDGTYYARLIVIRAGVELVLDSRPSDALALAVRAESRVFIAEAIVEEAGVPIDMIREEAKTPLVGQDGANAPQVEDERPVTERDLLMAELDAAIADENYELAAKIRDKLKGLSAD